MLVRGLTSKEEEYVSDINAQQYSLQDEINEKETRFDKLNKLYAKSLWLHPVISPKLQALASRHARMLDAGCGSGSLTRAFSKLGGELIGWDRDPGNIAKARSNAAINAKYVTYEYQPGRPLPNLGTFDVIVASYFLVHNPHPTLIDALNAQLNPGGLLIIREIFGNADSLASVDPEYWWVMEKGLKLITNHGGNIDVVAQIIIPWLQGHHFDFQIFHEYYPFTPSNNPDDPQTIMFEGLFNSFRSVAPGAMKEFNIPDFLDRVDALEKRFRSMVWIPGEQRTVAILATKPV